MFTVIIPTYNKAATLGKAIESVYAQEDSAWEIVVIDDGSKDDFDSAIAPYESDKRIRVIRQKNSGVSVARNRGIEIAREPYLAFLDADDEWLPNHLSEFRRMIGQEPGAGVYATAFRIQFSDGTTRDNMDLFSRDGIWREQDLFKYIYDNGGKQVLNTAGTCVWKEAIKTCGGFQPGERAGEDTDFFLRIAAYYDTVLNRIVTSVYHRELSTATESEGFLNYDWYFQKREQALLGDERIPQKKRHYIRCLLDYFRIHKARHYLMAGNHKNALDELRKTHWDPRYWKRIVITWGMVLTPPFVLKYLYAQKRKKEQI